MWYNGSVGNAIAKAKQDGTLLIVYVHDDSKDSTATTSAWNSELVQATCKHHGCVSMIFNVESLEAKQFAEFYPVTKTPISFFIDNSGVAITIVTDVLDANELNERIHKAADNVKSKLNEPVKVPPVSSNSGQQPLAERVEKIKQKIKEVQEKKQSDELEQQKEREAKRREDGKAMLSAKERQREAEFAEAAEERRRNKKADKEYLERLKEQIALDRAEKAERFQKVRDQENQESDQRRQERLKEQEAEQARKNQTQSDSLKNTSINFRLWDNRSIVETFESTRPFDDARRFIGGVLDLKDQFTLVQMYPRREFTTQDLLKTFLELELAPRSVIMVFPANQRKVTGTVKQYQQNWLVSMLTLLSLPFMTLFNFFYSFIFPTSSGRNQQNNNGQNASGPSSSPSTSQNQGNVRRLNETNRDPSDNATWNGNSTQQL